MTKVRTELKSFPVDSKNVLNRWYMSRSRRSLSERSFVHVQYNDPSKRAHHWLSEWNGSTVSIKIGKKEKAFVLNNLDQACVDEYGFSQVIFSVNDPIAATLYNGSDGAEEKYYIALEVDMGVKEEVEKLINEFVKINPNYKEETVFIPSAPSAILFRKTNGNAASTIDTNDLTSMLRAEELSAAIANAPTAMSPAMKKAVAFGTGIVSVVVLVIVLTAMFKPA